jgi:hypothetical protein
MHVFLPNPDTFADLNSKYTVLELDTIKFDPDHDPLPAYCVLDNIPLMEMATLENLKNLHANLVSNYKKKDWNFCEQAIEQLIGKWNGEMDSFYAELSARIQTFKQTDPGDDWDGVIFKKLRVPARAPLPLAVNR